jgi:hypothetical protein
MFAVDEMADGKFRALGNRLEFQVLNVLHNACFDSSRELSDAAYIDFLDITQDIYCEALAIFASSRKTERNV